MTKRADYKSLREGFGLVRGLQEEFVQACERADVPIEAIKRLVTPAGRQTMDTIALKIRDDWQAEVPESVHSEETVGNGALTAWVTYSQPDYDALLSRFAEVDRNFRGLRFEAIARCIGIRRPARVRFENVVMHPDYTSNALGEIDRLGLRPALYEELLSYAEKFPQELEKYYKIVALGSACAVFNTWRTLMYV